MCYTSFLGPFSSEKILLNVFFPNSVSAFKCWCQAVWQYSMDFPSHLPLGGDIM